MRRGEVGPGSAALLQRGWDTGPLRWNTRQRLRAGDCENTQGLGLVL